MGPGNSNFKARPKSTRESLRGRKHKVNYLTIVTASEYITNVVLLSLGIAVIVTSLMINIRYDVYPHLSRALKNNLDKHLANIGVYNVDTHNVSFTVFLQPIGTFLLWIGVWLVSLAMFGWLCVALDIRSMLPVYTGTLIASTLFHLLLATSAHTDRSAYNGLVLNKLLRSISMYSSIAGEDAVSVSWNAAMAYYSCCGVCGSHDFNGLTHWYRAPYVEVEMISKYSNQTPKIPIACCKKPRDRGDPQQNFTCAVEPTRENSNLKEACYPYLVHQVLSSPQLSLFVWISLSLEALIILLAIWRIKLSRY